METRRLILIRGASGTGKSTIAKAIGNGITPIFEADQFFTHNHQYKFDISKIKLAHQLCQIQTERQMYHGTPAIIVCNTFISLWEMESYLEMTEQYKYEPTFIRTPGPWDSETLFKRNKHNVPLDVIKRHINGYQPHEKEIVWSDMSVFL